MDPVGSATDPLGDENSSSSRSQTRSDPDQDVLEWIRKGDVQTALGLLMKRYGRAIYRYCREGLRDTSLAEDVHQQVFIEAHRDMHRFGRRSTLRTWLFGIAYHRVLDAAKRRRRHCRHATVE